MSRQSLPADPATRCDSHVSVRFSAGGGRTFVDRLAEGGALRLRRPKTSNEAGGCEVILVNTAGGIVEGDRLALAATLGPSAAVTVTSAAAEKVYRSCGVASEVDIRLALDAGSRLLWAPHETILFHQARVARRFDIDCAADAHLLAIEMIQFGRLAHGERDITGMIADGWRVRRDGRLVYADEMRIDGALGAILNRRAVAGGHRAVATLLLVAPDAAHQLEALREALDVACGAAVEAAASLRDGIIVARILARGAEPLRATVAAAVAAQGGFALPPYWG